MNGEVPAHPVLIPGTTPANLQILREWIDQLKQPTGYMV